MSGHSKFANIAHKKAANDAAKGKIFTRLGKEIMVAVKEGGPDVNNNSKLRQVVTKCKAANMPNDTINCNDTPFISYIQHFPPYTTTLFLFLFADKKKVQKCYFSDFLV